MGGNQSQEETTDKVPTDILAENTYHASANATYPYYLIQLSETAELQYKDHLVSDALVDVIREKAQSADPFTHIIAQTHGWNTPPDKAVAVPFTEFIGGMQNDAAMPTHAFNPLFVAFIWPAVPIEFGREPDALTRVELLANNERQMQGDDSDIVKAAEAAKKAVDNENEDEEEMINELKVLAENAHDDDDDDDELPEDKVNRLRHMGKNDGLMGFVGEAVGGVTAHILNPFQNLVFGRLMKRGNRTGKVMESVLGKLMEATGEQRAKVCLMANSLGAHVLAGILDKPKTLPYKIHTVFFVQGAITRDLFDDGKKFAACKGTVAGPIVCSHSDRDLMLKNIYAFFHGDAIGIAGVDSGQRIRMKGLQEATESPYVFENGEWNSVDGTEFIDEGNAVAGGHGDFKEDETTTLYWAAIKTELDSSAYDR